MAAQSDQSSASPRRALRLTFAYEGTKVELVSKLAVEMIAPPSDRTDEYEDHAGFWIELRDPDDRLLYRRIMHNPIQTDREAPSGDPDRPFTRVRTDQKQGTFTIIVPDLEQAQDLNLVGSPAERPAAAAKHIHRVNLKERPTDDPQGKRERSRRK
jgi:hypothetical protein